MFKGIEYRSFESMDCFMVMASTSLSERDCMTSVIAEFKEMSYHLRRLLHSTRPLSHEVCILLRPYSLGPIVVGCIPCGSWPGAAIPEGTHLQTVRERVGRRETAPLKHMARLECRESRQTTPNAGPGDQSGQW